MHRHFQDAPWESVREGRSSSFVTWSLRLDFEGRALGRLSLDWIQGCSGNAGQRTRDHDTTAGVSTGFSTSSLGSFSSHFPEHALLPLQAGTLPALANTWWWGKCPENRKDSRHIWYLLTTAACASCIPVFCVPATQTIFWVLHR